MSTLGIYVQVPFCQTKCTYCNFHTGVVSSDRFAPYIRAVQSEITGARGIFEAAAICHEHLVDLPVDTVYIGGGTPSLLDPGLLRELLETIRDRFAEERKNERPAALPASGHAESGQGQDAAVVRAWGAAMRRPYEEKATQRRKAAATKRREDTAKSQLKTQERSHKFLGEVTLEADPETIEPGKAREWVASGINRISFGSQSFVDSELKAAGRMHRAGDIYKAVPILRDAGIHNISFDLIAGLPKQTQASWRHSLGETIALRPEHVSIYMMEIDEGSRLGLEVLSGGPRYSARELPSDEAMVEFYELAQRELKGAGYEQYEISNWAKPGFASRHNLKYWRREPYLGFGAGAHSFSGTQRWANVHDAAAYVAAIRSGKAPMESVESVTAEAALEEELFLGLRQIAGIDLSRVQRQYGVDLQEKVRRLASRGMVEQYGDTLRLAPDRLQVSNEVLVELLR